ncbi:MAG: LysE family translocator [Klebsiella michiganensis]|nr:LysE family translocator [Klebsiella michiganensis]
MTGTALFSFWAFSLMFVMTPGADWAYAMTAGIQGRRVVPAVLGLLVGYVILTVIVAAGVGMLIAGNPTVMILLAVAGALYLLWLGTGMLRHPPAPATAQENLRNESWLRVALQGALVSGLNPKAFMFFLAFLPPFTSPSVSWSVPVQLFALGIIHTLSCSVVYMLVGVFARLVLSARPSAARFVGRLSGIVMLLLGAFLLYREIVPA